MLEINLKCQYCAKQVKLEVHQDDLKSWQNGALIQTVLGYLTSEQREMLQTRTCDECWDKMYKESDSQFI